MAVLHEERKLELNADCAEFCPFPGHQDLLAVGTYQLDEQEQLRHGRLYLFRVMQPQRLSSTELAVLECAGACPPVTSLNAIGAGYLYGHWQLRCVGGNHIHKSHGDCDAAGIFDARWLAGASEPALAVALSSGRVQLVLIRARDENFSLEGQGAVNIPSGAMVLSLDVYEKEAACMAASTSAGELATMKVALCAVGGILIKRCLEEFGWTLEGSHVKIKHCLAALSRDAVASDFGRPVQ